MTEDRIVRCHPEMASQRQVKTAAETVTANRGDDWFRRALDRTHEILAQGRETKGFECGKSRNLAELGARGKT